MKSTKITLAESAIFAFVGTLILFASTEVRAQPDLQKAIAAHINRIREDAAEYEEARKIVYGDVDGDGARDAVVQYTLEGAGGGNYWENNRSPFS